MTHHTRPRFLGVQTHGRKVTLRAYTKPPEDAEHQGEYYEIHLEADHAFTLAADILQAVREIDQHLYEDAPPA